MTRKLKLKRSSKNLKQKKRVLVVSEGGVTEREYLDEVRRSRDLRSAEIRFEPPGPTSPFEIVQKAKLMREQAKRTDPFDDVWCVFDVEAKVTQQARPKLREAVDAALRAKISVAISNPCFELWVLLHSEKLQAFVTSDVVQHRCIEIGLMNGKHLANAKQMLSSYLLARQYAEALTDQHRRNLILRVEDQNPSSSVYCLVDALYKMFPPRAV